MSQLEQLSKLTTIVADTGDFNSIAQYKPTDATTNPSLLLLAVESNKYNHLVDEAVNYAKENSTGNPLELALDKLAVNFGSMYIIFKLKSYIELNTNQFFIFFNIISISLNDLIKTIVEILKLISGRVSTEIDARLSYDTDATIKKARQIIALYEKAGIPKERILIKIASTWEGIQAAKVLESEGIHVNMTLMFSMEQAVACSDANATLISPFVGRILDYFKQKTGLNYTAEEDPGVVSVKSIYNYYKKHNIKTVIMGASFRNIGEILELAGIDLLTISPSLLDQLSKSNDEVKVKLSESSAKEMDITKLIMEEEQFRQGMEKNEMASFKLKEGIDKFIQDTIKLENVVRTKLE